MMRNNIFDKDDKEMSRYLMSNYKYKSDEAVYRSILMRKTKMSIQDVATTACPHYMEFVCNIFSLQYDEKPDYPKLIKLLRQAILA